MNKNLFTIAVTGEHECDHDHSQDTRPMPGLFSTTVRGVVIDGDDEGQYLHRGDVLRVVKHVMEGYGEMFEATQNPIFFMGGNMIGKLGELLDNATVPERASALDETVPDEIPADWFATGEAEEPTKEGE